MKPVWASVHGRGSPFGKLTEYLSKNVAMNKKIVFLASVSPTHTLLPEKKIKSYVVYIYLHMYIIVIYINY